MYIMSIHVHKFAQIHVHVHVHVHCTTGLDHVSFSCVSQSLSTHHSLYQY